MNKTREDAWALLCRYTQSENLRRHMLAVEAAMRHYARFLGGDADQWGMAGLLHDFDYEENPTLDKHPFAGMEILRAEGWPEEFIKTVASHAPHTGQPRDTIERKALFACDELCGFVMAVALVRPSKKLSEVEPRSVIKKMKDKAFARGVSREDLVLGAEELGLPLEAHIQNVIDALLPIADELGV